MISAKDYIKAKNDIIAQVKATISHSIVNLFTKTQKKFTEKYKYPLSISILISNYEGNGASLLIPKSEQKKFQANYEEQGFLEEYKSGFDQALELLKLHGWTLQLEVNVEKVRYDLFNLLFHDIGESIIKMTFHCKVE